MAKKQSKTKKAPATEAAQIKKPAVKKKSAMKAKKIFVKVKPENLAVKEKAAPAGTVLVHRSPDACSYPQYGVVRRVSIVSTRTSFILGVLLGIAAMSALTFLSMVSLYSQMSEARVVKAETIER